MSARYRFFAVGIRTKHGTPYIVATTKPWNFMLAIAVHSPIARVMTDELIVRGDQLRIGQVQLGGRLLVPESCAARRQHDAPYPVAELLRAQRQCPHRRQVVLALPTPHRDAEERRIAGPGHRRQLQGTHEVGCLDDRHARLEALTDERRARRVADAHVAHAGVLEEALEPVQSLELRAAPRRDADTGDERRPAQVRPIPVAGALAPGMTMSPPPMSITSLARTARPIARPRISGRHQGRGPYAAAPAARGAPGRPSRKSSSP